MKGLTSEKGEPRRKCVFLAHIVCTLSSFHMKCVRKAEDLMMPSQQIEHVILAQTQEEKDTACLHLKTSIKSYKWLALQNCSLKGHDESASSSNCENFIELVKVAHRTEIQNMLNAGERKSRRGLNQMGNMQRLGAIRWSSHYESIKSLIDMHGATCKVLEYLTEHSPNASSKSEVRETFKNMAKFEFVFILRLMHTIFRIIDALCEILQTKYLDILCAIRFFNSTKSVLQQLRESDWGKLLSEVKVFCTRNDIDVPDLDCLYKIDHFRGKLTIEHHYHFDVFNEAINYILKELNTRLNDTSLELLSLMVAPDSNNSFESFTVMIYTSLQKLSILDIS